MAACPQHTARGVEHNTRIYVTSEGHGALRGNSHGTDGGVPQVTGQDPIHRMGVRGQGHLSLETLCKIQ